jgi:hypothetical protein
VLTPSEVQAVQLGLTCHWNATWEHEMNRMQRKFDSFASARSLISFIVTKLVGGHIFIFIFLAQERRDLAALKEVDIIELAKL